MFAQRLRHTITLQQQSTTDDGYGGNVGTWSDVATMRAGIEPIGGTEAGKNGQNVAEQNVRVVIRYRAGITAQMRVVHGASIYQVLAVATRDEAARITEMTCRLGVVES